MVYTNTKTEGRMNIVGEVNDRVDRPSYVRFDRVDVEDKAASLRAGHYVGRDVDLAYITPAYSKDVFKIKVVQWFANLRQDVANNRLPSEWVEKYKDQYKRWQAGQETPLDGTPIKGWGVISPAQQGTLIAMNVLTVEDLAVMNDEGAQRVGMGSLDLKNKALAWLAQLKDKGPLTVEIASVKAENLVLKGSVESLTKKVEELTAAVRAGQSVVLPPVLAPVAAPITAADILADEPVAAPWVQVAEAIDEAPAKRHRRTKAEMLAVRAAQPTQDMDAV